MAMLLLNIFTLPTQRTVWGSLFNLTLLLILYLLLYKMMQTKGDNSSARKLAYLMIVVFCLFSFWGGDWFHYYEIVQRIGRSKIDISNIRSDVTLELPYWIICKFTKDNYILFRLIVWGGALLLVYFTGKRLELGRTEFLIGFSAMSLVLFSYARVSLAMSIAFCGMSFWVKPINKRRLLSYIIAVVLIYFSLRFHKSAVFIIPVFLFSIFPARRGLLLLAFLTMPLMVYFFNHYGSSYILESDGDNTQFNYRIAQNYLLSGGRQIGLASTIITYLRFLLLYIASFSTISIMRNRETPPYIVFYSRLCVWTVVFASVFLFARGVNTETVYYRFMNFSIIPLSIVYGYLICKRKRQYNNIILFGMAYSVLQVLVGTVYLLIN